MLSAQFSDDFSHENIPLRAPVVTNRVVTGNLTVPGRGKISLMCMSFGTRTIFMQTIMWEEELYDTWSQYQQACVICEWDV